MDGELNFSDLLTKKHDLSVEDLSTGSNWQSGYPWMRVETVDMPLFPYQSLTISPGQSAPNPAGMNMSTPTGIADPNIS